MDNLDAVRELPVKPKQDSPVNLSDEPEAARVSGEPLQIRCRVCGEVLTLNPDSMEARENRTDPWMQIRSHLIPRHAAEAFAMAFKQEPLLNIMLFEAVNSPDRFQQVIETLVAWLLREPVETIEASHG